MKFPSDNHNRAVRSIAQMVEEKLTDIENFFRNVQAHVPVNVTIVNDLTRQEEDQVKQTMQNIYNLLKEFCMLYEIKPTEMSLKKEIAFKAAMLWQEISGATGKSMAAYGPLDDELKEEFQQYATRLTEMVNDLYLICK